MANERAGSTQNKTPYDGMQAGFSTKLQQLIKASGGKIYVVSGYRSPERQQQLFNAAVKKYGSAAAARKWVAPPGKSNHNHGVAADLGGDLKLAHKLAAQFGLRFPMGHEPWHIEPVGGRSDPEAYTTPPDQAGEAGNPLNAIETQLSNLASIVGIEMGEVTQQPQGAEGQAPAAGDLGKFMAALKQVESGGNYKAKGPQTKYGQATGGYQWLDSTWAGHGGFKRAADAPPEVQEARALSDFQGLVKKYGGDMRKVAMAWHGGPNTKLWGPKTQSYANKVMSLMGGADG